MESKILCYQNDELAIKSGNGQCFIKENGNERKAEEKDTPLVGYIASEGKQITEEEYNAI